MCLTILCCYYLIRKKKVPVKHTNSVKTAVGQRVYLHGSSICLDRQEEIMRTCPVTSIVGNQIAARFKKHQHNQNTVGVLKRYKENFQKI